MQRLNIDPRLVQMFVRVVEAGSFSEAARREGCTPSSVSRQMTALEEALGVRLLQRTTRQLSLTEAGSVLQQRAGNLFDELQDVYEATTQLSTTIRGTLRISTPPAFGMRYISPLIAEFLQKCPHLRLDLGLQDRFVDVIGEGFDLAIRSGHVLSSSLIAKRLASNERVLVASPEYLHQRGVPSQPEDLTEHDCLAFRYVDSTNEWRFRKAGQETTVPISGRLESNNGLLLLSAVENHLGIALLPLWMAADSLKSGSCQRILAEVEVTATDFDSAIYALYESRRHLPAKVQVFLNFLQSKFSPLPPWLR